jgi:hypothetical protein
MRSPSLDAIAVQFLGRDNAQQKLARRSLMSRIEAARYSTAAGAMLT